jgi:transposase
MNILNWQHWHVIQVVESSRDYQIIAEPLVHPLYCLFCESPLLYRHENKQQLFLDIPLHGKRTGIQALRRRYLCRSCHRKFWEPLPDMHSSHFMTNRLVAYIEREVVKQTFASLAEHTGLDEKTIRLIFREMDYQPTSTLTATPLTHLGIDELYLPVPRCVLSDVEDHRVIDLLPGRSKKSVTNYLFRMPERTAIKVVAMDMWKPYRDAVHAALPQAQIVIDRFHVVRMANRALETVRKTLRAKLTDVERRGLMHDRFILLHRKANLNESQQLILDVWTRNMPELGIAYELKESFFALWDADSRQKAITLYQQWQARIPTELQPAFQPLLTALTNWHTEIFNYFDHKITNSYTESLNGLLRVVSRQGRGYSFETIRAKLLMTQGFQKENQPGYRHQWRTFAYGRASPGDEAPAPHGKARLFSSLVSSSRHLYPLQLPHYCTRQRPNKMRLPPPKMRQVVSRQRHMPTTL